MPYNAQLIVNDQTRHLAIAFLINAGHHAAELNVMSTVGLANLYHAVGGDATPSDTQRRGAEMLLSILQAMPQGALNVEAVRAIVREEIEASPGRKLTVTGPRGSVSLTGPTHYATEKVIKAVARAHPVMTVGPAGCGKTTIGEHAAKALQLPFYITSTINDTHELMGFVDGHGKYHDTPFRVAFEHGGLWIADEIDAWDASALLAANSALANGYANFPDGSERITRHADFRMVATANTFGTGADRVYVGRTELDAASLDRFAVIEVGYDLTLERMFANGADRWLEHVWHVRKLVEEKRIRHVVSSRAVTMGAAALADGEKWGDVNDMYLFKGMSAKDRSKII